MPIDELGSWIQTASGKRFFPVDPRIEDVDPRDIAHALSLNCRYTGHVKHHFSVAQHCLMVMDLVSDAAKPHALLHDASEAYLSDVSRPVKRHPKMEGYREIEYVLQRLIYRRFGLSPEEPQEVARADREVLWVEANALLAPLHPDWVKSFKTDDITLRRGRVPKWTPEKAEREWLKAFKKLGLK